MANIKSNALFHFTKNIDSLKGILENGFSPRFSVEDVEWFEPKFGKLAQTIQHLLYN